MKRVTPENHAFVTTPLDSVLAGLGLGLSHGAGSNGAATATAALARVRDWLAAVTLARRHEVSALFLRGLRTCPDLLAASGIASTISAQMKVCRCVTPPPLPKSLARPPDADR